MTCVPNNVLETILPRGANRLGFGCGGLITAVDRANSRRLIETAIDSGIGYFDTARMYGWGEAEGLLGELLAGRRDRFIIASKAGILPANRSLPLRVLNRGIGLLHRTAPQLAHVVPKPAASQTRFGVFGVSDVRKSLERSLRQLRTDYLDCFLLHECTPADIANPELQLLLQTLQTEGKIRTYGVATGIDATLQIAEHLPHLNPISQIPSSIWNMNVNRLPLQAQGRTITHSTLTGRFHAFTSELSSNPSLAKKWQAAVQIDPHDKVALAKLLLAHALHSNRNGIVLFFSSNRHNTRASAEVAAELPTYSAQIAALNAFLQSDDTGLH